ncbi:MAG: hypothetical protein JWO46_1527 [Nocardioidaceae bacterium]|nr:hypothetical protein [Nocardioidaceae bacterium]
MRGVLSVITVTYGSAATLADTLPTWRAAMDGLVQRDRVEWIVVDNGTDGSGSLVRDALGSVAVTVIKRADNPGFSVGCNVAAERSTADHVFFLNPDVSLRTDSLQQVLDAIDDAPDRVLTVSLRTDGEVLVGARLTPFSLFRDARLEDRAVLLGPSGGAAVYPRSSYVDAGGFDPLFFAWGEDADLAMRLAARGERPPVVLDLRLEHSGGHSLGNPAIVQRKAQLMARNRLFVAARCLSTPALVAYAAPGVAFHVANAARKARSGTLRSWAAGTSEGLRRFGEVRRTQTGPRLGVVRAWRLIRGTR